MYYMMHSYLYAAMSLHVARVATFGWTRWTGGEGWEGVGAFITTQKYGTRPVCDKLFN